MNFSILIKKILFFAFILLQTQILSAQITYLTSIKPLKLILDELVEGRAEVKQIIPDGISPHHFEPLPSTMRLVEEAKAIFYVSRNMDPWIENLHHSKKIGVLYLIPKGSLLSYREDNPGVSLKDADPHFWTNPKTVESLLPNLLDKLIEFDPSGKSQYSKNMKLFSEKLEKYHQNIGKRIEINNPGPVILSHPFFRYFLHQYHIQISDIISTEGDFQTSPKRMSELITSARNGHVKAILTMSQQSSQSAEVISEATGVSVILLYPLGYSSDINNFMEYLDFNLQKILGKKNE